MNIKRLQESLEKLNEYTDGGPGINRLAYTNTEKQAKEYLKGLFEQEGLMVKMDAVGNIIARREGANPDLSSVAIGSHIDSVYEAGRFDGTVGVMTGLELIRSMNEQSITTEHPVEVISFASEESSRFGMATMGSKAMAGLLNPEDISDLTDKDDISLKDAFREHSLDIDKMHEARRSSREFKSFLELHIEQGPVLENEDKQIGIVTGIAGPTRFTLQISGQASHSGTTPMGYRHDALLGASEVALALESIAHSEASNDTVATIGVCEVKPGGMNIVPGEVDLKVDIRGTSAASREKVVTYLFNTIKSVERSRQLTITSSKLADEPSVDMSEDTIASLQEICDSNDYAYRLMPSGAGHDAMNMARLCPAGLVFIPSKNGVSHNPEEFTSWEQIETGINLMESQVLKSAKIVE
ncbi:Zn-dependent hydrolase [Lentibacillus amyloliquefaciens]|uniref:Zn-dependent hydrolase n=1 Tax=Lentibacillus amyloliquefaciens TaxID=1472767 RepID=A0A0U3NLQ9_9BACI|nr:Zn-dependent hydrolase [Lentibacillus amyloliquefaciens]ALX47739.1 Zn-dependent hydrolase [Lentibacillus amyloliquefaciens]